MQLSTGVQFWATRRGDTARLLWVVVEPSMGKPGWLCRMVDGSVTAHSDELENMEPANG